MIFSINGDIDKELLDNAIAFFNERELDNLPIDIYLCSAGGSVDITDTLVFLINKHKERTTVYAYGAVESSAFVLLFSVDCKIEIIGGCLGMYHQVSGTLDMSESLKPSYFVGEALKKQLSTYCVNRSKVLHCRIGLNKHEIAKYSKGQDVWFSHERLNEFKQNIING